MVDRPGQLMSQHRQCLALPMCFLQAGEGLLAGGSGAQEQHGRFRKGPFEIGMPDRGAGRAVALASRFPGTLDYAAGGDEILHAGEALNVMDFI